MAETQKRLRTILETIRENTQHALALLGDAQHERSLRWKCTHCGHVKHFTRAGSKRRRVAMSEVQRRCISNMLKFGR